VDGQINALRGSWTVVLADDAPETRRMVARTLTKDGRFEILAEARDGIEAVEVAEVGHRLIPLIDVEPGSHSRAGLRAHEERHASGHGACQEQTPTFFPERGHDARAAKAVCARCP
jgi:CheY-like chemotaxis protein